MQITEFSKKEIEEFHQYNKHAFWKEYDFYVTLDKSRREILGLFLEINSAYGNWRFMNNVLPALFEELYQVFKNTLKKIKNNLEINYELWDIDNWYYLSDYKELQNEVSKYYYLFEYLVSKFKQDFILSEKLSDHYTKNSYDRTLKKIKIRILNVFYYFHQKSIHRCKNKAKSSFIEIIREKLNTLDFPILVFPDSLLYEFNLKFCRDKTKDLFKPTYGNMTYKLGLEPIWEDENTGISIYYFDKVKNPFLLLTKQNENSISEAIKESGEEGLFQEWFHTPKVKEEIVSHYFHPIYYKYLRKKDLTQEDINKSKSKIYQAYLELKEYYGISNTLSELIKVFRNEQEVLIEKESPRYPLNVGDRYDPDMDIEGHSYYILNSIFPIIPFSWTKYKKEIVSKEIAIIDLETTGDNFYSDSIIEIGICKLNLDTGDIEPLFNQICCEKDKEISHDAWIFKHSDLNYYDIVNALDISKYRKEIQHILNIYPVTSYPQNFDFTFLKNRGFKIRKKFWDPLVKFQYLLKIPYYDGDYKWPSIQEAWNYFFPNTEYKISHRALDDALHETQLIYAYYKEKSKKRE